MVMMSQCYLHITEADGRKVWCLGNIEEIAVARGNVDQPQSLGENGASYLLGLDKDYKPHGAFINDPKTVRVCACVCYSPYW